MGREGDLGYCDVEVAVRSLQVSREGNHYPRWKGAIVVAMPFAEGVEILDLVCSKRFRSSTTLSSQSMPSIYVSYK